MTSTPQPGGSVGLGGRSAAGPVAAAGRLLAEAGAQGIGFAIPSSMARYVMDQLIQFGEVRRGTLGIFVQDLTPELAGAFDVDMGGGVLVAETLPEVVGVFPAIKPVDLLDRRGSLRASRARIEAADARFAAALADDLTGSTDAPSAQTAGSAEAP